ncbi:sulfurtransferase TusA family protein [Paenibacillus endoradicis]|uniref:sulfurtransferase TusA family protein n=1 Tax=Paenibacillus endoradicis TaxID=2972487 RepID=UPI0021590D4F|nr:sulfurtransferase TusA family protein [Paenibacillus endoradicis]MCR8657162.1 sulfurtransferase TusA family protein [Paenibacillus endoradicis]
MIQVDVMIDAKGLACPMPIVKTRKVMKELKEGQVLHVQATDRGSMADIEAWAESVGHQYIGTQEIDQVLHHYIRKSDGDHIEEKQHEHIVANEELLENMSQGGILLDVREQAEYMFGHITGAIHIPLGELEERHHELSKDENIYVICRTGKRSDFAARKLVKLGYLQVYNVLPGIQQWTGELSREV